MGSLLVALRSETPLVLLTIRQWLYVQAPISRCSTNAASKGTKTLFTSIPKGNFTENVTSTGPLIGYSATQPLCFRTATYTHAIPLIRPTR
ncbi:hypothetical protein Gogos_014456 [Gossypium gossypioides]|uniref:Uncharacterized protein n=1 Tax=Gossypium gossypioides TaxID=34282 RepID=A0A7J9BYM8_GOSGO|nr:hypothetical protein [Gossypium gossypioides]